MHLDQCLLLSLLALLPASLAADDAPTWVERDGIVYGAKPDDRGPIGGGAGYTGIVTSGDLTAQTLEELIAALAQAQPGQTVFIPGETEVDLTTFVFIEGFVLHIPAGVTLAGNRGANGSLGASITCDALNVTSLIQVDGPGARVTGLRIRGPNTKRYIDHHTRAFGKQAKGDAYYYKFPASDGIHCESDNLTVDNCEISGFSHGGIHLIASKGHTVNHCLIHHCQYQGLGYGVVLNEASVTIEYNLFDSNRHSIAGTGRPGTGYIARNNVELGTSLSHCFDMHGGRDRQDGTDIAGGSIEIYNNTFRAPETPVVIRGVPQERCDVYHNWFPRHPAPAQAVHAESVTRVFQNAYGPEGEIIP